MTSQSAALDRFNIIIFYCLVTVFTLGFIATFAIQSRAEVIYQSVESTGQGKTSTQAIDRALINAITQVNGAAIGTRARSSLTAVTLSDGSTSATFSEKQFQEDIEKITNGIVKSFEILSQNRSQNSSMFSVNLLVEVATYQQSSQLNRLRLAFAPFRLTTSNYRQNSSQKTGDGWKNVSSAATSQSVNIKSTSLPNEKRLALIIGNADYQYEGKLRNTINDAKLLAETLRSLKFDVIELADVGQKDMKRAIKLFGEKLEEGGKNTVGLFYFSGHGAQIGDVNFLIPTNANIKKEADFEIEAVSANSVQQQMAYAGNRLNIIILDACRTYYPTTSRKKSISGGLAPMDATKGFLIAYATAPGKTASDGTGNNSPYAAALSKAILLPGLTVERVFKEVRNSVASSTNNEQIPWEASSLTGEDYYFNAGSSPLLSTQPTITAPMIIENSASENKELKSMRRFENYFRRGLENYATQTRRFAIVDRSFIEEQNQELNFLLGQAGSGNEISGSPTEELAKIANRVGTDYLITGVVEKASSTIRSYKMNSGKVIKTPEVDVRITYRIIDVASSQIKFADTEKVFLEDVSLENVADILSKRIGEKILNAIFPIYVLSVSGDEVTLGQGGDTIEKDGIYSLIQLGDEIFDPYTRESLGQKEIVVGAVRIVGTQAKLSTGKITELLVAEDALLKNDYIIRPKRPRHSDSSTTNQKKAEEIEKEFEAEFDKKFGKMK